MPGVRVTPVVRPSVRLRAVPPLDPPFDDESESAWDVLPARGQLALDLPGTGRSRPPGYSRPNRRRPTTALPLPSPASAPVAPEARQAARRFLVTCLEVLNGYRPVSHLRALVARTALNQVIGQLTARLDQLKSRRRHGPRRGEQVRLRRVRVCQPRPGVAEAAAVLDGGGRVWAIAFRVELHCGSWLATALDVL